MKYLIATLFLWNDYMAMLPYWFRYVGSQWTIVGAAYVIMKAWRIL